MKPYQLLDFGDGRKLERFGDVIVARPCPAADRALRQENSVWQQATAEYVRSDGNSGKWHERSTVGEWIAEIESTTFQLRLAPTGQVGVFPEQVANWRWIARQVTADQSEAPLRVLNLFAYTGGSTLAAAQAGAHVTHVDAAKNVVAWARRNAELSGLKAAPIRWIVEDAAKFVAREVNRGNTYDAIILDPPSYGHGPKGEVFRLSEDLMPLLRDCATLTQQRRAFFCLSCHTPGFGPAELEACLADAVFGACSAGARGKPLNLIAGDGRQLNAGACARWPG